MIIANYWFREALMHFGVIMGVAVVFTLPLYNSWLTLLASILFASLPTLFSLTAFIYLPSFFYGFLPKVEMISSEQEKLASQSEEIKKCKRTQFQAPTLIIIYYVYSRIGNVPLLPANDLSAEQLNKLFGSDKDKLKHNLSRLYKPSELTPKERAEMIKGIEFARTFFAGSECKHILNVLNELEFKLHRTKNISI